VEEARVVVAKARRRLEREDGQRGVWLDRQTRWRPQSRAGRRSTVKPSDRHFLN
jgi:hypothetical protein